MIKALDILNLSLLSLLEALVFKNWQVGVRSHNCPCELSRLYLGIYTYMNTLRTKEEAMNLKERTEHCKVIFGWRKGK